MKSNGISVFVSSHDFSFVKQVADKCLFLEDGIIKVQGTPGEVLNNRTVKESLTGEDNNYKIEKGQLKVNG